ncbi:DUF4192 domain-containing protein, partial [Desertihabitans aurantiacus]|uniref:DUF4192 domain-containing protein n=1 Tax=Desertihabitans aurantiacus TaxID=2282477 RepID=UPI000DF79425
MTSDSPPTDRVLPTAPPTIRAGDPSDVLGVIPYLVGFLPADDLVVVLLADRCVVVTARMDLASVPDCGELAQQVEDLADLHGADAAVVVAYCADPEPVAALFEGLPERLDGVRLVDLLHVDGRRWWSWLCRAGCCPPEGRPYDVASSRTAAAAVFAGLTTLPSRDSLAELV